MCVCVCGVCVCVCVCVSVTNHEDDRDWSSIPRCSIVLKRRVSGNGTLAARGTRNESWRKREKKKSVYNHTALYLATSISNYNPINSNLLDVNSITTVFWILDIMCYTIRDT